MDDSKTRADLYHKVIALIVDLLDDNQRLRKSSEILYKENEILRARLGMSIADLVEASR
jgi:hypothetical protein